MKDQFRIAAVAVLIILAVGLVVTGITKSYIDRNKLSDYGSMKDQQAVEEGSMAGGEKLPQNGAQNAAKEEAEKKEEELQADSERVETATVTSGNQEEKELYLERLSQMDRKLNAGKKNTKEYASSAYKAWDGELNEIYQMIRSEMTEEEFVVLRDEERGWLKERDQAADKADEGLEGEDKEIAYLNSLTESTKVRTYELVELYFSR